MCRRCAHRLKGFDQTAAHFAQTRRCDARTTKIARCAGRSAWTAQGRTGHRLSPDEVRIIIEGGKPVVYERIFRRKAGKTIWTEKRRAVLLHGPAVNVFAA
jgi:hypothetical protein